MIHKRLPSVPWLRKPQLAQRTNIQAAPQILKSVMAHIQQHWPTCRATSRDSS